MEEKARKIELEAKFECENTGKYIFRKKCCMRQSVRITRRQYIQTENSGQQFKKDSMIYKSRKYH
jgi:hypothetical protein